MTWSWNWCIQYFPDSGFHIYIYTYIYLYTHKICSLELKSLVGHYHQIQDVHIECPENLEHSQIFHWIMHTVINIDVYFSGWAEGEKQVSPMAAKRGREVRRKEWSAKQSEKCRKRQRGKRKRDLERWRDRARDKMTWDEACPESLNWFCSVPLSKNFLKVTTYHS